MPDFGHLRLEKMDIDQLFCILLSSAFYIMVDYQRMGSGGTRPATITLNNHALVYFKEFLQSKELVFHADKRTTDLAIWEEQERRLC